MSQHKLKSKKKCWHLFNFVLDIDVPIFENLIVLIVLNYKSIIFGFKINMS